MNNTMTEWEALSIQLEQTVWKSKAISIAFTVLALLDQKGMSKQELAIKMNVKPQFVSRIVKGKANLTLETLVKLEQALGAAIIEGVDPTETISCHSQNLFKKKKKNRFSSANSAETSPVTTVSSDTDASLSSIKAA